jgi:5'-3' exonuclease
MNFALIDAKNCMFRFGFVHRDLASEDGECTGAAYGLLRAMIRLKQKYNAVPVVVWDGEGESWRHKFYAGYKSHRKEDPDKVKTSKFAPTAKPLTAKQRAAVLASKMDKSDEKKFTREDILKQIPVTRRMLSLIGIHQLEVPCVEADDLISLCAFHLNPQKHKVYIYSTDKDFYQLIRYGIITLTDADPKNKMIPVSAELVHKKFRCSINDVLAVRTLCGDPSDGIPNAVPGVGPVKALKLLDAGLSPSNPKFENHSVDVCRQIIAVKDSWDRVHRNWQLMRLPMTHADSVFSDTVQKKIEAALVGVSEKLFAEEDHRDQIRYRRMVSFFGELGMREALADKQKIWRLPIAVAE